MKLEANMVRAAAKRQPGAEPNARLPPSEVERKLYEAIKGKENVGIWIHDLKRETCIHDPKLIDRALKNLQTKNLVKMVANVNRGGKKLYMGFEFEPAKEISGGTWYIEGKLDKEFIGILKEQCVKHVRVMKVATLEMIWSAIGESGVFTTECTKQQILEIMGTMVLDKEVEEVKSSGRGDFCDVPLGKVCYRKTEKRDRKGPIVGAMVSVPCGVCPRIMDCTPDGIISPSNCAYYTKWLQLDF